MRMALLAAVLVAATLDPRAAAAQAPAADVARAKDLYKAAEAAMAAGRFDDAVRDYGAAYDASKDPALFYKLGRAHERAGHCDTALTYYRRYLAEGAPNEAFTKLAHDRIRACGGDPARPPAEPTPPPAPPKPEPGPVHPSEPAPAPTPAAPQPTSVLGRHKGPWLLVGGSIAFVTVGAVLAYSANAAERDVEDLYAGFAGAPPAFNNSTRQLYDDAVDEGQRYQTLSRVSFGIAGALAVGAAVWFFLDRDPEQVTVTPAVAPDAAGVSAAVRF